MSSVSPIEIEGSLADETVESAPEKAIKSVPLPARLRRWIAPVWFGLGVLAGMVGFAAYTASNSPPGPDSATIRAAARDGAFDAIATVQAGGVPSSANVSNAPDPAAVAQAAATFTIRDANRIGDPNAPVTIFEFADFQCSYCGRFFQLVKPDLFQAYVDTGKVQVIYKHYAFLGQESLWAAVASECAADQGRFWEYHDLLFSHQPSENAGPFNKERLAGFAKQLGLDMAQFGPCLEEERTRDRVQADSQEGQGAGVRGTPEFFVNGQLLVGAQPIEAFQAIIEPLLSKK